MRLNISSTELLRGILAQPVTEAALPQPVSVADRRITFARHISGPDSDIAGVTTLGAWLRQCSADAMRKVGSALSSITSDEDLRAAKSQLPVCFPSAVLSTRDRGKDLAEKLVSYSGLIAVDIDTHNRDEALAAVNVLAGIPYIAFSSLSASGRGAYAVAVTDNLDYARHKLYWRALSDDIAERTGYVNDPQTKDITRARYMAYTPTATVKDAVIPFSLPEGYEEPPTSTPTGADECEVNGDTIAAVEDCVRQWEEGGLILGASTYETRYQMGTALKNLGPDGYGFYERLCAGYTHPRTPRQEWDGFPNNAGDGQPGKISLGTFFWVMRDRYGISPTEKEVQLHADELNPEIARIVHEVAKVYQCPEAFAVAGMFAAVAAVAGKKFSLWDGKRSNYAQIWLSIVAPSGTGKSEALRWFFRPVEAIEAEDYKVYRTAVQEWKKGGEQGPKPILRRRTAVDTTPEVRDQILADNRNGLCLVVDELKGLFDDLGRYNKSGEVGRLLSNYSNSSYYVDRKTQEPLRIENPVLSIVGTIQPSIFPLAFGGPQFTGSGFLPRWCFVWGDTHPRRTYSDLAVSSDIRQCWRDIVGHIDTIQDEIVFRLSDEARGIYENYYNELEDKIHRTKDDSKKELYAKIEINVLRWALITAILAREYDTEHPEISGESMQYAIDCFRYFEKTGLRAIDAVNGQSPRLAKKDLIVGLKSAFPGLVQSQLAKSLGVTEAYISKVLKKK